LLEEARRDGEGGGEGGDDAGWYQRGAKGKDVYATRETLSI
jgi:hypothetical protein